MRGSCTPSSDSESVIVLGGQDHLWLLCEWRMRVSEHVKLWYIKGVEKHASLTLSELQCYQFVCMLVLAIKAVTVTYHWDGGPREKWFYFIFGVGYKRYIYYSFSSCGWDGSASPCAQFTRLRIVSYVLLCHDVRERATKRHCGPWLQPWSLGQRSRCLYETSANMRERNSSGKCKGLFTEETPTCLLYKELRDAWGL